MNLFNSFLVLGCLCVSAFTEALKDTKNGQVEDKRKSPKQFLDFNESVREESKDQDSVTNYLTHDKTQTYMRNAENNATIKQKRDVMRKEGGQKRTPKSEGKKKNKKQRRKNKFSKQGKKTEKEFASKKENWEKETKDYKIKKRKKEKEADKKGKQTQEKERKKKKDEVKTKQKVEKKETTEQKIKED